MFSETGILPMVLLYARYVVNYDVKLPGHPERTGQARRSFPVR
jgi:hypothetical protein